MVNSRWKVIAEYDSQKQYKVKITPKMAKTFQMFKMGDIFSPSDFAEKHKNEKDWLNVKNLENAVNTVYLATNTAQKIGLVMRILSEEYKTSFDQFVKISEIHEWLNEITPMNLKNTKQTKYQGTRGRYAHTAWKFNDWLVDKEFEFDQEFQISENTFKRKTRTIKLEGLIHLLKLLQNANGDKLRFNQICKKYLRDPMHEKKRSGAMRNTVNVIKTFFVFYDVPLTFSFNHKSGHKTPDGDDEKKLMTLDNYFKLLTVGKPTIVEKAVFLCKLHRGLDNITFADRFNYQVFGQLVQYFKHEDHNAWDLDQCPVPIDLVRVKTRFKHRGFLDRDAITAIQDALEYRKKKTDTVMKINSPLFLTKYGQPISEGWIYEHFCDIADRAKLRHIREGYSNSYNVDSHESRDLLKSIAKKCKVDEAARDHFIGHMPKDSYEKETTLFPEMLRSEYMKMSAKLNIFTKFTSVVNGTDDSDELKAELNDALVKLKQKESSEELKDASIQRHDDILKEQQRQMRLLQDTVNELKKEIRVVEKRPIEFCCVSCSTVHAETSCPACNSKLKRIFEEKTLE